MKTSVLQCLAALAFLMPPAFAGEQMGPLRSGAAKVDITPAEEMFPMAGRQVLGGVHDPLYARALVLDNGSSRVAFITADTAGFPNSAEIMKEVTAELGIPATHVSLVPSHDHNTPTFGAGRRGTDYDPEPYLALMKNGILEAARQANARLQPARIGFGTGKAYVNTNRDQKIGDSYKMGYAPEGPSDKAVAVMLVTTPSGDPIAVWTNYAVHGVVMFLSRTREGKSEVTGDLGGATASYVEDRLGDDVVAIWSMGAAGDQNPLFMSTYNQDSPDAHDEGAAGWALLDVQARRLGEEVVRVARSIQNTAGRAVLWAANGTVTCPGRRRESTGPARTVPGSFTPLAQTGEWVEGDPVEIPISLMMINDIALANVSGEVFSEIGQKLKRESLFDRTAMVTLATPAEGDRAGYIPSERAFTLPAAMAANNRLQPGCAEDAVVSAFLDLERQYLSIWRALQ
jgi:neutral ceramidase